MSVFRLIHHLRTTLWPVPVLCVLVGVLLSYATVAVDDGGLIRTTYTGGPDAALVVLGTVAASMITLTGIVLTIVLVVVQLAMGQFSPRSVRAILADRPSQLAIGIMADTQGIGSADELQVPRPAILSVDRLARLKAGRNSA